MCLNKQLHFPGHTLVFLTHFLVQGLRQMSICFLLCVDNACLLKHFQMDLYSLSRLKLIRNKSNPKLPSQLWYWRFKTRKIGIARCGNSWGLSRSLVLRPGGLVSRVTVVAQRNNSTGNLPYPKSCLMKTIK
jgi:hypothetical protein